MQMPLAEYEQLKGEVACSIGRKLVASHLSQKLREITRASPHMGSRLMEMLSHPMLSRLIQSMSADQMPPGAASDAFVVLPAADGDDDADMMSTAADMQTVQQQGQAQQQTVLRLDQQLPTQQEQTVLRLDQQLPPQQEQTVLRLDQQLPPQQEQQTVLRLDQQQHDQQLPPQQEQHQELGPPQKKRRHETRRNDQAVYEAACVLVGGLKSNGGGAAATDPDGIRPCCDGDGQVDPGIGSAPDDLMVLSAAAADVGTSDCADMMSTEADMQTLPLSQAQQQVLEPAGEQVPQKTTPQLDPVPSQQPQQQQSPHLAASAGTARITKIAHACRIAGRESGRILTKKLSIDDCGCLLVWDPPHPERVQGLIEERLAFLLRDEDSATVGEYLHRLSGHASCSRLVDTLGVEQCIALLDLDPPLPEITMGMIEKRMYDVLGII
jgi:hypothetical protein